MTRSLIVVGLVMLGSGYVWGFGVDPGLPLVRYDFEGDPASTVVTYTGSYATIFGTSLNLQLSSGGGTPYPTQGQYAGPSGAGYCLFNTGGSMGDYGGRARTSGTTTGFTGFSSFTIAGWLYAPEGSSNYNSAYIVRKGSAGFGSTAQGFAIRGSTSGRLDLYVDHHNYSGPASTRSTGVWRFFAITWDGSDAQQPAIWYEGGTDALAAQVQVEYLDESLDDLGVVDFINDYLTVANEPGGARSFAGQLDAIAIWGVTSGGDGALNPEQIEGYRRISMGMPAESEWHTCFDPVNATACLQSAIDAGVNPVRIPDKGSPWKVDSIYLRSDLELVLEDGVELVALSGAYPSDGDKLLSGFGLSNIIIRGEGDATIRMLKHEYDGAHRHAIGLYSCSNVTVENLTVADSGGDGIYIGNADQPDMPYYCENITVRDCLFDNHRRLGITVISGQDILIENCQATRASGELPQSGIDLEPNNQYERLVNCVIRNCVFDYNTRNNANVAVAALNSDSEPVSITFEDCVMRGSLQARGIGFNRLRSDGVGGVVVFRRCVIEDNAVHNVLLLDKPASTYEIVFDDCDFNEQALPSTRTDIWRHNPQIIFTSRTPDFTTDMGNVRFVNCRMRDNTDRPLLGVIIEHDQPWTISQVSGEIEVTSPYPPTMEFEGQDVDLQLLSTPVDPPTPVVWYSFDSNTSVDTTVSNEGSAGMAGDLQLLDGPVSTHRPVCAEDQRLLALGNLSTVLNNGYGNQTMGANGGRARAVADMDDLDGLESFTIAGWIWTPGIEMGNQARLVTKGGGGFGFDLRAADAERLELAVDGYVYTGPPSYRNTDTASGSWQFVAVSWDGSQNDQPARFYIAGLEGIDRVALADSSPGAGDAVVHNTATDLGTTDDTTSLLTLLNTSAGNRAFAGYVDHVAVWGAPIGYVGALGMNELEGYRRLSMNYLLDPTDCAEIWTSGEGLVGDLNQDCYINLLDYAILVRDRLVDYAILSEYWLVCNNPPDFDCR